MSTALEEMQRVVAERYPVDDWNIYCGAGLGWSQFQRRYGALPCSLLNDDILPICQYFAYIEVVEREFVALALRQPACGPAIKALSKIRNFAMRRVSNSWRDIPCVPRIVLTIAGPGANSRQADA